MSRLEILTYSCMSARHSPGLQSINEITSCWAKVVFLEIRLAALTAVATFHELWLGPRYVKFHWTDIFLKAWLVKAKAALRTAFSIGCRGGLIVTIKAEHIWHRIGSTFLIEGCPPWSLVKRSSKQPAYFIHWLKPRPERRGRSHFRGKNKNHLPSLRMSERTAHSPFCSRRRYFWLLTLCSAMSRWVSADPEFSENLCLSLNSAVNDLR